MSDEQFLLIHFNFLDKAHPRRPRGSRGPASSEERRRGLLHPQIPGGSISCYFDFSSLQSRIFPVWGWLSVDVFEYRKFSPGGLQVRVGGRGRRRFGRSSAEDQQQDQQHRRESPKEGSSSARISSRINHIDGRGSRKDLRLQGSAAGSIISSSEEQRTDHPRRPRGSRESSSSEEQRTKIIHVDPEDQEDLPRQRSGAEVFYIHRYQVVAFLVISISARCNLWLFQSEVGSVWLSLDVFEYRKFSPGGLQVRVGGRGRRRFGRSSADDQQQDQSHRRKRIKGKIFVLKDHQ